MATSTNKGARCAALECASSLPLSSPRACSRDWSFSIFRSSRPPNRSLHDQTADQMHDLAITYPGGCRLIYLTASRSDEDLRRTRYFVRNKLSPELSTR